MSWRMNGRRSRSRPALLLLPLLLAQLGMGTAEQRGLEIAREVDRRDEGFGDSSATIEMVLRNRQGSESIRQLRIKTLEVPDPNDGDKTVIVFDHPRDVKGTGLLTFTHIRDADDQWLYLPALKRVKRISSKNKSGPFMGSEFAYEDMSSQEVSKYTYRYLRDEPCAELSCFVIERFPVYKSSGYTRQVTWIDKAEYRVQRIEFYDRKNALLKTLTLSRYERYLGKHWRALDLFMENHQTGKTTRMLWKDYRFKLGLGSQDFTTNSLKRVR